jgi:hypothetical protein
VIASSSKETITALDHASSGHGRSHFDRRMPRARCLCAFARTYRRPTAPGPRFAVFAHPNKEAILWILRSVLIPTV